MGTRPDTRIHAPGESIITKALLQKYYVKSKVPQRQRQRLNRQNKPTTLRNDYQEEMILMLRLIEPQGGVYRRRNVFLSPKQTDYITG